MNAWLTMLEAEGVPWLLVGSDGRVEAAAANAPLEAGAAFPAAIAWPPAETVTLDVPALGAARLYPLPDGRTLVLWRASYAALTDALEEERARLPKFVSTLTHELRLPLTSIKGYADLLVKGVMGPVSDPQKQFLEVIRNNVERMTVLIDRVSEMGKLESGRLRPKREPLMLKQAIEAVAERYRPRCEEKQQTLTVDVPDGLPLVAGDMPRVAQILEAMLDNAHKYAPQGGVITVQAEAVENDVRVRVCDTGPGIAADDAKKVFDAFFRSEIPEVREHPGWGLSLHVAKQLAEHMGGALTFANPSAGKGVCFAFTLPTAQNPT